MSVVLFRVDERLIHGQVVVGWGTQLHPQRIVVVDDELAGAGWEQELYCFGLPAELTTDFASVAEAREALPDWLASPLRTIVLTRDVASMRRLAAGGALEGQEVNIGGIHFAPGRHAVLPYVYLSEQEAREMRQLAAEGVAVSARDLPGARRVELGHLLKDG